MTKQEFLEELRQILSNEVSAEAVMDAYGYYSNYIDEQVKNGKSEQQVIEELGKPALIARSIVAAQTGERVADEEYTEDGKTKRMSKRKDYSQKVEKNKQQSKEFTFDFNAWYAKVLFVAIVIIAIIVVFFLLKFGLWLLIKVGIPVLLCLGIIYLILYYTK